MSLTQTDPQELFWNVDQSLSSYLLKKTQKLMKINYRQRDTLSSSNLFWIPCVLKGIEGWFDWPAKFYRLSLSYAHGSS